MPDAIAWYWASGGVRESVPSSARYAAVEYPWKARSPRPGRPAGSLAAVRDLVGPLGGGLKRPAQHRKYLGGTLAEAINPRERLPRAERSPDSVAEGQDMARYTPNRTDIRLIVDPTNRPTKVRKMPDCGRSREVQLCVVTSQYRRIHRRKPAETWAYEISNGYPYGRSDSPPHGEQHGKAHHRSSCPANQLAAYLCDPARLLAVTMQFPGAEGGPRILRHSPSSPAVVTGLGLLGIPEACGLSV